MAWFQLQTTPTIMRKMNSLFGVVLVSCFIIVCVEAHVCLIFPPQRGGIPDAVFKYAGK